MDKKSIYQIPLALLATKMTEAGYGPHIAGIVYRTLHKRGLDEFENSPEISQVIKTWIKNNYSLTLPELHKIQKSKDGTVKFLYKLNDGNLIESVLIPFHKKFTVCLSTQVGCAMNCSFCFTATEGLTRNLSAGEIVGQYLASYFWLKQNSKGTVPKPNLVFMGQGEPLHNFDEVKQCIELLLQSNSIHLGERQITLSTCGYLPGLKRVNELPPINIALSLHSPFDSTRDKLIPVNKIYPIAEIIEALKCIKLKKRQFLTFEYLLIKDINDRPEDAEELHNLLSNLPAIVNLIPFNPFPGSSYQRSIVIDQFKEWLVEKNLRVMIRSTKGDDILAACGQLKGNG